MAIDIRIRIDLSSQQSRTLRRGVVAVVALAVAGVGVAVAAPKHKFSPGDVVSSSKMNENFADLDGRLAALEQNLGGALTGAGGAPLVVATAYVSQDTGIVRQHGISGAKMSPNGGDWTVNFAPGTFSEPPTCTVSAYYQDVTGASCTSVSAESVSLRLSIGASAASFALICVGKK